MPRTSTFDFSTVTLVDPEPVKLVPSPQQVSIYDWVENGTGNALIVAVAGAGKTTTLIQSLSRMLGSVAFAAYNKRIADEIAEKVAKAGLSQIVKVATFHSFGFSAWRRVHREAKVEANKIRDILDAGMMLKAHPDAEPTRHFCPEDTREFVEKLVSLVRQCGIGILTPINSNAAWNEIIAHYGLEELLLEDGRFGTLGGYKGQDDEDDDLQAKIAHGKAWALRVLRESIKLSPEIIDFDDMLYMPLYEGIAIEQYDWVLIDEAQDSNPTRRALAKAMLRPGGRLLAVGDPAQAIYGFTGADSESLENIKQEFGCVELSLTVSYRCPRSVVRLAQTWVSHIEAAETAPEGSVSHILLEDLLSSIPTTPRPELEASVVLCRKNAPLIGMAFGLIRQGIPCHVEGRDIGGQIKSLVNKWKTDDLKQMMVKINEYRAREVQKFMARGQESRADALSDKCDTVGAIVTGLLAKNPTANKRDLLDWCWKMFGDSDAKRMPGLTLSSIHKSKGREWETVYWLGFAAYQPSPFARQEWQMLQETNLMYVAATRAKTNLVQVAVPMKGLRGEDS